MSASAISATSSADPSQKCAVVVGINYTGTDSALSGCVADAHMTVAHLVDMLGYSRDRIKLLTDEAGAATETLPTYDNIMAAFGWLVGSGSDEMVLALSCHGTFARDDSGDEKDGRDEALVPLDYEESGNITDDDIHALLGLLPATARLLVLTDACHSGSVADLQYRYVAGKKNVVENYFSNVRAFVTMVSGCKDDQYSADAEGLAGPGTFGGAMTNAFWTTVTEYRGRIHFFELLRRMRAYLKANGFTQIPQITCSRLVDRSSMLMDVRPKENFALIY